MRRALLALTLLGAALPARADAPAVLQAPASEPRPIVGFRVLGDSKITERTLGWLAHVRLGDLVGPGDRALLEATLMSSELFKSAVVTLEDAPGGVIVVATLDDKMSWIAAPTIYVLPSTWAIGVGYAENDLFGENRKFLAYGQIGNRSTFLFATYLDPAVAGTPLLVRLDLYPLHKVIDEYMNPPSMPTSLAVARTTTETFLDAGALVGWTFAWWLIGDLRLRGAYVYWRDTHDPAGNPLPAPQSDGWDFSVQARLTLDARHHLFGVTWGPFVQAGVEPSVPVLSTYRYQLAYLRAYYSWRLFGEHELELRGAANVGRHLAMNDEYTLGGQSDLRGYALDQFRGDTRLFARAEYSIPIAKWRPFAFRAIGFWDGGYIGYHFEDPSGMRNYLPSEHPGASWTRNDVGGGLRIYVNSVVLPLLGLDVGYGLEGHKPEVYFEVGLTDF